MEYKKTRWEIEYDKFKAENEELKHKMATIRREQAQLVEGPEYASKKAELAEVKKVLAKYKRIEDNSTKIENVLKFKKQLVKSSSELLAKRTELEKLEDLKEKVYAKMDELDKNMAKIMEAIEKINDALAKPNLKDDEREALMAKREDYINQREKNNNSYIKDRAIQEQIDKKLETYDKEKLDEQILKNERLISKCDLIGANLVKGKSLEDITVSMNNFKFTPNKDFAEKVKQMRSLYGIDKKGPEKEDKDNKEEKEEKQEPEIVEGHSEEKENKEETAELPKKINFFDKFLQKHPRVAKFVEVIRNKFKVKEKEEKTAIVEPVPVTEGKTEEKKAEEVQKEEKLEGIITEMDRIGEDTVLFGIVEQGSSEFLQSIRDEKAARAVEKLAENRRLAESRDVEKYGSRYNDMTYIHKSNEEKDMNETEEDKEI